MKSLFHFALIAGILYFISFCVDGMRSVLNDTHFICYDIWHNYIQWFRFLMNMDDLEISDTFFKLIPNVYQLCKLQGKQIKK